MTSFKDILQLHQEYISIYGEIPINLLISCFLIVIIHFILWKATNHVYQSNSQSNPINKEYSVILSGTETKTHGEIHRNPIYPNKLISVDPDLPDVVTLYDAFQRSVNLNPMNPCFGYRPMRKNNETDKMEAGDYKWFTYQECGERANDFQSGLMALKLIPKIDKMRMLGMYAKNCIDWVIAEQALYMQSGATVPLYDTLGPDTIEYVINQTKLQSIVCSVYTLENVITVKPNCKSLKNVIVMLSYDEDVLVEEVKVYEELSKKAEKLKLNMYTFTDIENAGKKKLVKHTPPKANSIATFCYTSGTTGQSKGAMLSHENMNATVSAVEVSFKPLQILDTDIYLSYLPLAHVMERAAHACMLRRSACIGFYQGETLKIKEDLVAIRPTIFISVPRLLTKVVDGITKKATASPLTKFLFTTALETKVNNWNKYGYLTHSLWDKILFKKVANAAGLDRVRCIVTGSAPISAECLTFLRVVFQTPVLEGYGQTEGGAGLTISDQFDLLAGHVGGPVACNEVMLEAIPDMGYLPTDKVHGRDDDAGEPGIPCKGRGEICYRGPNVFMGYYKMPDKTDETVDKDGWCHTGDVGIWLPNGQLKIVDRKKNIFKLSQGEYIAPEKVENIYTRSPSIAQAFIYGDSLQHYLVGVLVPDYDNIHKWASENGINLAANASNQEISENSELKAAILKDCTALGKANGLHSFEQAKKIILAEELFSVENEILTPTFKLKRHEAKKIFQKELDAMYA